MKFHNLAPCVRRTTRRWETVAPEKSMTEFSSAAQRTRERNRLYFNRDHKDPRPAREDRALIAIDELPVRRLAMSTGPSS